MVNAEYYIGNMEREVTWSIDEESITEGEDRLQAVQFLAIPGTVKIKEATINAIEGKIVVQREGNGVELETFLQSKGPLAEIEVSAMVLQIAAALSQAESYVLPSQNLYPPDLSPQSVFVQDGLFLFDLFSPNNDQSAYWRAVKALAVLGVYAGCGGRVSSQEVREDLGGHLASLHWGPRLSTMLLDMFYSKTFPSFSCLPLA